MAFFSRRRRCVERTRRTCSRSACRFWMIRRICRRSVSSCVSPGPRVPMGALVPAWRLRWVHMPVSRGSRYSYCASCTCSRPSFVRARWAKISRMSPLRSTTRTPSSSSIARACEGESSLSITTRSHSLFVTISFISCNLPAPRKLRGSGDWRVCKTMATVSAPAVSTSAASSSIEISVERSSASMLDAESPASTARSLFCVKS